MTEPAVNDAAAQIAPPHRRTVRAPRETQLSPGARYRAIVAQVLPRAIARRSIARL
jgi:hypothetical protein